MMGIGATEFLVLPITLVLALAPIGAALWALITLSKIRVKQEDIWRKLETIEQMVQGSPTP